MNWRPWRRRQADIPNGAYASTEKERAKERLANQRDRWPEVREASDRFATLVERAMRGQAR